jgi:hypothetical protein
MRPPRWEEFVETLAAEATSQQNAEEGGNQQHAILRDSCSKKPADNNSVYLCVVPEAKPLYGELDFARLAFTIASVFLEVLNAV